MLTHITYIIIILLLCFVFISKKENTKKKLNGIIHVQPIKCHQYIYNCIIMQGISYKFSFQRYFCILWQNFFVATYMYALIVVLPLSAILPQMCQEWDPYNE